MIDISDVIARKPTQRELDEADKALVKYGASFGVVALEALIGQQIRASIGELLVASPDRIPPLQERIASLMGVMRLIDDARERGTKAPKGA